jgi:hypothetical protein
LAAMKGAKVWLKAQVKYIKMNQWY